MVLNSLELTGRTESVLLDCFRAYQSPSLPREWFVRLYTLVLPNSDEKSNINSTASLRSLYGLKKDV